MYIEDYIIKLYNSGYSNKYIAKNICRYNKHINNILTDDERLKFVDIIIVDYITSPSL